MSESQGGKANRHGDMNRESVARILMAHHFRELNSWPMQRVLYPVAAFEAARREHLEQPERAFVSDVVVCRSVHGAPYMANFMFRGKHWPEPLALMCREQHSSGSAIEKLEFLYANIIERFPCRSMVLLAGSAFTPDVIKRGAEMCVRSKGKIAGIIAGLDELRSWLTDGALFPQIPSQDSFS